MFGNVNSSKFRRPNVSMVYANFVKKSSENQDKNIPKRQEMRKPN